VQIVHGSYYSEIADRQYATPRGSIFDRGSIFFKETDGKLISAAGLKSGYIVAMNPEKITEREGLYGVLIKYIPELSHDIFIGKASKKDDPYEEIAHRVSKENVDAISALKLPGVSVYKEKWRFYPAGDMASQIIGFTAYKGDVIAGRYGLERQYDSVLERGKNGLYVNFFAEVFSSLRDTLLTEDGNKEGDLVLTLDPSVQSYVKKIVKEVNEKYASEETGAIIINPNDGSIYAMEVAPSFDINKFNEVKNATLYSNPLVENVYEMGSIVKPLTMAVALDKGVVTAKTTYNDTGSLTVSGYTIYNYDKRGRGTTNMQGVLNESLNTGAAFAMQKVGKVDFRKYFLAFGLGDKTGIDLPNEGRNLISNLNTNRDIEFVNASYGQGIALTPIAMTRALAVLGNGGYIITPHLVSEIDYKGGLNKKTEIAKGAQVLKKETSEEITRMLVEVVDKALLNGEVKMTHYSVAAKTGTAQIALPNGKGYYEDRYLHSFFGYFPAYNPKFLIFLYTKYPKGEKYASHTLTYPFMGIAKFLLSYYEVPPDR
jgi:cell division protein FtsI/penicillin-binding protein 2